MKVDGSVVVSVDLVSVWGVGGGHVSQGCGWLRDRAACDETGKCQNAASDGEKLVSHRSFGGLDATASMVG
ncbi:hypothetical protein GCM10009611_24750 [Arthrobacter roseus]